jgi:hypothetical protein
LAIFLGKGGTSETIRTIFRYKKSFAGSQAERRIPGSRASRLHAIVLNRNDRRLYLKRLFVWLALNCIRDGCVSFQFFVTKNRPYYLSKKIVNTYFVKQIFVNGY